MVWLKGYQLSTAILEEIGMYVSEPIEIKTGANAAIGIACRARIDKIRHTEVNQLWSQHRIATGDIELSR